MEMDVELISFENRGTSVELHLQISETDKFACLIVMSVRYNKNKSYETENSENIRICSKYNTVAHKLIFRRINVILRKFFLFSALKLKLLHHRFGVTDKVLQRASRSPISHF